MFALSMLMLFFLRMSTAFEGSQENISCCMNGGREIFCLRGNCSIKGYTSFKVSFTKNNSVEIHYSGEPFEADKRVKAVAERGLDVFRGFKSLTIEVDILHLNATSFIGINPTFLTIRAKNVSKCTFVGMPGLTNLTISGVDDELSFHKDAFSGLLKVTKLIMREAVTIYSYPNERDTSCGHYLCGLKNLEVMRMQVNVKCSLFFGGVPPNVSITPFSVDKYSKKEKEAICPITTHLCHYDKDSKCGLSDACNKVIQQNNESKSPIKTASTAWIPLVIIGAVLLTVAVVGVGYYFYQASPGPGYAASVAV